MVNCLDELDTISYGGQTETTRRWKCPPGSADRYVYLLFEDTTSSLKLVEVEVYAPSTAPSLITSGGEYVTLYTLTHLTLEKNRRLTDDTLNCVF